MPQKTSAKPAPKKSAPKKDDAVEGLKSMVKLFRFAVFLGSLCRNVKKKIRIHEISGFPI